MTRLWLPLLLALAACSDGPDPACDDAPLPSRAELRCEAEFLAQAARPRDESLPGARTIKTVLDQASDDALYFVDTNAYPLHINFAIDQLGWPPAASFAEQYFSPQRRFLLGAVTHYEGPDVMVWEIGPYDTMSLDGIVKSYDAIHTAVYFRDRLYFHPTSEAQEALVAELPERVAVITTDELWAGIDYQPLNLGETYAQVHVLTADELATTYVGPREIAVLDRVPNDLSVVAAVVTEEFQTPLSHVNVLSQQRGTPNMGLRGAQATFAPYDGRWVRLRVGAFEWEVEEVTADEAEAWFDDHRPPVAEVPEPDYTVDAILDIDLVDLDDLPAVGGKAAHYGELRDIGGAVRIRDAIVIPVRFYRDFLVQHGFDVRIAAMLQDEAFRGDGLVRQQMLADLRADMLAAPIAPSTLAAVEAFLESSFPATRMKFRSSTTAEDLLRHSGAGLYDSKSGQVGDPERPVDVAIKTVWASVWNFRAFEERSYVGIDHLGVAMAVLANPSFGAEDANGVAITANIYEPVLGGVEAFFINAQVGEESVVEPAPGVTCDSLLYHYLYPNQPATYYAHSSIASPVLTREQLFELGRALWQIREHFASIYDPPEGYARMPMDVEWKLDGGEIWIKQARPYPGRGR